MKLINIFAIDIINGNPTEEALEDFGKVLTFITGLHFHIHRFNRIITPGEMATFWVNDVCRCGESRLPNMGQVMSEMPRSPGRKEII